MRSFRLILLAATLGLAASLEAAGVARCSPFSPALAQKSDWKKEFEQVCAKTQDAMSLPDDELRSLIARCDKLKPVIDRLGETERKVFSRRLKACRDLYAFVLESRSGR